MQPFRKHKGKVAPLYRANIDTDQIIPKQFLKKIEKTGDHRYRVTGDLTLHGVTREVTLDVEGPSTAVKDPMGNVRVGATATAKINRQDFGITWSKSLDGGGVMVGDQIDVTIDVEGTKKK